MSAGSASSARSNEADDEESHKVTLARQFLKRFLVCPRVLGIEVVAR
mgnify:CR=1 FL=1